MPVVFPNVPHQINSYDCGAYVCHYASHLFGITDVVITKSVITSNNPLHGSFTKSTYVDNNPLNITEFCHELIFLMNKLVDLYNKMSSPLLEHKDNIEADMPEQEDNAEGDTPEQDTAVGHDHDTGLDDDD